MSCITDGLTGRGEHGLTACIYRHYKKGKLLYQDNTDELRLHLFTARHLLTLPSPLRSLWVDGDQPVDPCWQSPSLGRSDA
jgi:hypothetical protein